MKNMFCGASGSVAVSWAQTEGSCHAQNHQPCEDVVFLRAEENFLFCGLADGKSGAAFCREGGRACLEAVFDYIAGLGVENLLDMPFRDELPCDIMKAIRKKLLHLSQSLSAPWAELASTLLAIALDLKTGRYMLLHLGDGCMIGVPDSGEPVILSSPENGLSPFDTWLTTSACAVPHLRVRICAPEDRKRILILSDGATCLCKGRNIPRSARELLAHGEQPQLHEQLIRGKSVDDATCILLEFRKEEGKNG